MTQRPLEGVRVLDLSRLLPGPFLTLVLADLGADVVKIEDVQAGDYLRHMPPMGRGSAMSGRYLAVNRGKRSLVLDLKSAAGLAAFHRMAAVADVVVESFRPGVMDRLGVGWDALRAVNPRLILCSISGYGQTGPFALRAGHDLGYVATAGALAMGGERGGPPAMPGVQLADLGGGALWGATGILAALLGRERSGVGQHLDISMTEGALALLAAELGNLESSEAPPTRGETVLNGATACYSVYRCSDGKYLAVGALEPKFWLAFNAAIGRVADGAEVGYPPSDQEVVRREVQAILDRRPRDEWAARLAGIDCCVEPILELDELAQHPQHVSRGVFFDLGGHDAPLAQVRLPIGDGRGSRPPPRHGEHGREVLADYGFGVSEIDALLDR